MAQKWQGRDRCKNICCVVAFGADSKVKACFRKLVLNGGWVEGKGTAAWWCDVPMGVMLDRRLDRVCTNCLVTPILPCYYVTLTMPGLYVTWLCHQQDISQLTLSFPVNLKLLNYRQRRWHKKLNLDGVKWHVKYQRWHIKCPLKWLYGIIRAAHEITFS